jgi:hypothetical protein
MAMATPSSAGVSHEVEMRIMLDSGGSLPMPCTLRYEVTDPFAVSATFRSTEGTVTWVFARDLLAEGLSAPAGEGDIRVSPVHAVGRSLVRLELSSPAGHAVMEGPMGQVEAFLARSFDVLPKGYEWQYLNFDTALAELLNGGAA